MRHQPVAKNWSVHGASSGNGLTDPLEQYKPLGSAQGMVWGSGSLSRLAGASAPAWPCESGSPGWGGHFRCSALIVLTIMGVNVWWDSSGHLRNGSCFKGRQHGLHQ